MTEEDIAEFAATGGALVTAIIAQRRNEAGRSRLQRRIGAMPPRRAREELTVRVGALLGGTLTYLLTMGATEGLHRLRDRDQRREAARTVGRILAVAATAPDGSLPDEASCRRSRSSRSTPWPRRPAPMRRSGRRLPCCAGWA